MVTPRPARRALLRLRSVRAEQGQASSEWVSLAGLLVVVALVFVKLFPPAFSALLTHLAWAVREVVP